MTGEVKALTDRGTVIHALYWFGVPVICWEEEEGEEAEDDETNVPTDDGIQ